MKAYQLVILEVVKKEPINPKEKTIRIEIKRGKIDFLNIDLF